MAIFCTVCGLWDPIQGQDRLDICPDCYDKNFAGAQPPIDVAAPSAREVLQAYVNSTPSLTLTPRQVQHLRRIHERWNQAREEHAP